MAAAATVEDRTNVQLPKMKLLEIKTLSDVRWIERIRVLDKYCFPVSYSEKYYEALMPNGVKAHNLSQTAFYNEILVGSITVRYEPLNKDAPEKDMRFRAYIMTIGVLEPYRGLGIATRLLQTALANAAKDKTIDYVALHVQKGSSALDFYKKFGFTVKEEVPDYYTNIEPTAALYLTKPVVHQDKKEKKK